MIIESGIDVIQVLRGWGGGPPPGGLWMVGMEVVFDGDGSFSTLPHCEFSLYRELDHLPRTHAFLGPHGWACRCPACTAERRMLEDDDRGIETADDYDYGYGADDYADYGTGTGIGTGASSPDLPRFDPVSRRWVPDPARAYRRWTRDEEVSLARSHLEGLSTFDISWLLQRQPGAIRSRLQRLGFSTRRVTPPTAPPAR
jgi:hypothetical protein